MPSTHKLRDMNLKTEKTILNEHYHSENAEEVITGLIDQKINFLKLKNLTNHVIYYKPDEHCQSEIERLEMLKKELTGKFRAAKGLPLRLKVVSYLEEEQLQ